ncbi:MAG: tetratricopeptide repeat protein [Spirulina sp. SIO3F2]|nr:tetratricopeptide repeat protein [Spirulina sp. SIO3F2]
MPTLETQQRLSQSLLWQLQRHFFDNEGMRAWNTGKVPHYATSNPFMAKAYAQVVLGFLRDGVRTQQIAPKHPVYIVELGAGSGRFAYHFLKQFFDIHAQSPLSNIPVKYLMTDFAQSNLDFWQSHSKLQPFLAQDQLDFAHFDITQDQSLNLVHTGITLTAETLKNPLIVLANYFFDSIPQDLFTIQNGQLSETLLTLTALTDEVDLSNPNLLEDLEITYSDRPLETDRAYDDPAFNQILQDYQTQYKATTLLFPVVGLNGLKTLRHLSSDRLLLLSADKGYHHDRSLEGRGKPQLTFHKGCFSLMVNYPAIAHYVNNQGGIALLPQHRHRSMVIGAFCFGLSDAIETRFAYQTHIEQASPDDFFTLKKIIEPHFDTLSLPQILAYLRLSGWDFKLFLGCFENLMAQVKTIPDVLRPELDQALQNVGEMYYSIGEAEDLPFQLAMLFYKLGNYSEALSYLNESLRLHGDDPGMFYNKAKCYCELNDPAAAVQMLARALSLYPEFEAAQEMQMALQATAE